MSKINNRVIVASLLLAGSHLSGAQLTKDGKPTASIVINRNATRSAQLAAFELQSHVERISGVKLPIANDASKAHETMILVGETPETVKLNLKSADFKNQEYLVRVQDNLIVLMGRDKADSRKVVYDNPATFPSIWDEIGTVYAVYDFLERLGVRWYLPTELGTTFTPSSDLTIADLEIRRAPYMTYREVSSTRYPKDLIADSIDTGIKREQLPRRDIDLFNLRQRLGGKWVSINHSLYTYYDRFLKTHPDWFAQGYDDKPPQLCYSNPEVLKQVVQDIRDYFDGRVELSDVYRPGFSKGFKVDVFPIVPMDNCSWCKCPKCQSKLKPKADRAYMHFNDTASDYFFEFVNNVAREIKKSHPDKYIGTASYHNYYYPPEHVKLESNIVIMLCMHSRTVYSKPLQENINRSIKAWKQACPENPKLAWAWFCFPALTARNEQFRFFPGFMANHVKDYMKKFVDAGIRGIFIEPSYMDFPYVNGILMDQLEIYINWKLADDPTLDADRLFAEFFVRYYGKAAEPMRKFYQLVEKTFCDPDSYPTNASFNLSDEISWGHLGTEERMKQLSEYMDTAEKLADTEPFRQRVALFNQGVWQYMQKGRKDYLDREGMMAPTMQQTAAPKLTNPEPGNPLTLDWNQAGQILLRYDNKGGVIKLRMYARLAHDGEYFYILYQQNDVEIEQLHYDGTVWENDAYESFFAKQRGVPYHQLGVNANGKWVGVEYEGTVTQNWDFKGKIISRKDAKAKMWKLFMAIPLDDIVLGGIKPGEMLYFNVIRVQKCKYLGSWIPTFSGARAPNRLGEVYLEK